MPNDYYSDATPGPDKSGPAESQTQSEQETQGEEATVLLPKAVLAGKEWKPGEEIMLEIVQMTEDGAVAKYASEHEEPHEEEAPSPEMASMKEEGGGGNPGGGMYS